VESEGLVAGVLLERDALGSMVYEEVGD